MAKELKNLREDAKDNIAANFQIMIDLMEKGYEVFLNINIAKSELIAIKNGSFYRVDILKK